MMTNRTQRRAEDFDRALTARGPKVDPATAALVAVAGALAALPQKPAPAFRDALRTRLMAEAASIAASAPVPAAPAASVPAATAPLRTALSHPAMQAVTAGLAATVAATGVGVGASRSLPGDALYDLKRTVERWQVGLAGGAVDEAQALLEHAQTRLDEVRGLLERGGAEALARIRATLDELNAELASATGRLLDAARDGSRAAYDRLAAATAELNRQIVALLPSLPADARAAASESMRTLNVAKAMLLTLPVPPLPSTGVTPGPTTTSPIPTTPGTTTGPPITVSPPPITVSPPPITVSPPPITVSPPPVTITPPTVTLTPLPTLPPITIPPL